MNVRGRTRIRRHILDLGTKLKIYHFSRPKLQKYCIQKLGLKAIHGAKIKKCKLQPEQIAAFERFELSYFYIEPTIFKVANFMDWINCNTCCRQPGDDKERIFMLSSCGHIFCDTCLNKFESKNKCKVCSTQCQLIHLSSKMKPDTQIFFQDPANLLKQHQIQLTKLLEFQKEHRTRLVTFHRKMLYNYKELEGKYKIASERIQQLERENVNLKKILNFGSSSEGVGAIENGSIGGYTQSSHFATPHESYRRAIFASGNKISPQTSASFISPGVSRISPGRLTLVKGNGHASPFNNVNSQSSSYVPQESGKVPSSPIGRIGTPIYGSNESIGKRSSPANRLTTNSVNSSPSAVYQSFYQPVPPHYSQVHHGNQSYSQLLPGSQQIKSIPNHMQRMNCTGTPQSMICSPDPSILQRSMPNRTFSKY